MLTARLILPEATYPDASDRIRFNEELLNGLRDQPDIGPVTLASHAPFAGTLRRTVVRDEIELNAVPVLAVATGYFDATGIGIERGRGFIQGDGTPGSDVAVVSEQFASRQWPGEDAVGERLQIGDGPEALSLTVVGIANSLFEPRPDRSPVANGGNRVAPGIYVPYRQEPVSSVVVIASRPLATDSAVRMLRATVQNLDPDLPLFGVRTVDEYLWLLGTGNRGSGRFVQRFRVDGSRHVARGYLWRDGVWAQPAQPRDRCSHGSGRHGSFRVVACGPSGHPAVRNRSDVRDGWRLGGKPCHMEPPDVRNSGSGLLNGYPHFHGRSDTAGNDDRNCLFEFRPPRREGGSRHCLEGRLILERVDLEI